MNTAASLISEAVMALASRKLLEDTQMLLSQFGIIFRIGKFRERDKTYNSRISALESLKTFESEIGILQEYKILPKKILR